MIAQIVSLEPKQTLDSSELGKAIADDNESINPSHAAYLGLEIGKAASCLETGKKYQQDQKC